MCPSGVVRETGRNGKGFLRIASAKGTEWILYLREKRPRNRQRILRTLGCDGGTVTSAGFFFSFLAASGSEELQLDRFVVGIPLSNTSVIVLAKHSMHVISSSIAEYPGNKYYSGPSRIHRLNQLCLRSVNFSVRRTRRKRKSARVDSTNTWTPKALQNESAFIVDAATEYRDYVLAAGHDTAEWGCEIRPGGRECVNIVRGRSFRRQTVRTSINEASSAHGPVPIVGAVLLFVPWSARKREHIRPQ
ncbi:hypothetical protein BJ138DRAFT_1176474 [Hygrophoropsis aurantiaca]|uniref:Uncharacterized protein n=1 Tax=Hygrophoropsis aurantiaca TaxID=72124 RepID=A0ACB8AQB5_9AGAM|nr:hypothetical protein BJ138DRAFT_1176474 [Hygrophoropsis aurantiaca]